MVRFSFAPSRAGYALVELLAVLAIVGLLAGLGFPRIRSSLERARVARAVGDIRAIQADLMALESQGQPLPATLNAIGRGTIRDPWGRPYVYVPFPAGRRVPPGARRDRFLVPVNSTFDLYSLGRDGQSAPAFTAAPSLDDVVRANDGGYIGLAANY
ncbi:MAG TPA: prepilin-type N-terminal cleavage/methylation domain-containing protein [Gemmatimonadales bacterium]|nr:prepilin-type N-terminal cleavage/methylation domain-containing protein [Gemmatimonadales bacterium]